MPRHLEHRQIGDAMGWDWGRPFGAEPGSHRRFGMAITFGWVVVGIGCLLFGVIGEGDVAMMVLGSAMLLLALVAFGMAAGVIPRRGRK